MIKINSHLLPIKAHYFFFLAAMGPILPFLPVMGKQLGISEVVMGGINALLPLFFIIVKPAFGYLIDRFQEKRKLIFLALLMFGSLLFSSMVFIPNHHIQKKMPCGEMTRCEENNSSFNVADCEWQCENNSSNIKVDINLTCTISDIVCGVSEINCTLRCSDDAKQFYTGLPFWAFVLLMSLGTIGYNVSNSISDAICFDVLGEGKQMKYGQQRVWGTIGFGLTAFAGGYLIDYISQDEIIKDYTPAYMIALGCMVLDILSSYKLKLPPLPKSESILRDIGSLVKQPHIATFLTFATLIGICDAAMIFYLLWFLEELAQETDQVKNIKLLQGLTVAAETLFGEVIFFYLSGKVLAKLGYGHCLSLCFAFYALRLGLVSCLTSPWWVIPIEMFLQGPTYAMAYTTIVAYASAVSPPGTSGTMQGLVAGMDDGLGYAVGSILAGVVYRAYGGRVMFLSCSILAACSSVTHCILYMKFFKHSINKPQVPSSKKQSPIMHEMSTLKTVKSSDDLKEEEKKFINDCST